MHIKFVQNNYLLIKKKSDTIDTKLNGHPQELVNKVVNLHLKSLNKIKPAGPEKCLTT